MRIRKSAPRAFAYSGGYKNKEICTFLSFDIAKVRTFFLINKHFLDYFPNCLVKGRRKHGL